MTDNGWNKKVKKGFTGCNGHGGTCLGTCRTKLVVDSHKPGNTIATCRVCGAKYGKPGSQKANSKGVAKTPQEEIEALKKENLELKKQQAAAPKGNNTAAATTVVPDTTTNNAAEKEIEEQIKAARKTLQALEGIPAEVKALLDTDEQVAVFKEKIRLLEARKRELQPPDQRLKQCKGRLKDLESKRDKERAAIKETEDALHALQAKLLENQAKVKVSDENIIKANEEIDKIEADAAAFVAGGETLVAPASPSPPALEHLACAEYADQLLLGVIPPGLVAQIKAAREASSTLPADSGTSAFADAAADDEAATMEVDLGFDLTADQISHLVPRGFSEGEHYKSASAEDQAVVQKKAKSFIGKGVVRKKTKH